jgi:hypothetical protein
MSCAALEALLQQWLAARATVERVLARVSGSARTLRRYRGDEALGVLGALGVPPASGCEVRAALAEDAAQLSTVRTVLAQLVALYSRIQSVVAALDARRSAASPAGPSITSAAQRLLQVLRAELVLCASCAQDVLCAPEPARVDALLAVLAARSPAFVSGDEVRQVCASVRALLPPDAA